MINFKANFIKSAVVQKDNKPSKVSFVELEKYNADDYYAMKDVAQSWGYNTYAYQIFLDMPDDDYEDEKFDKKHFYALTSQKTNFSKLNPDDVLSVVELNDESDNESKIEYLQTDPFQISGSDYKTYSHIGSAVLDSIKEVSKDKTIKLTSVDSAIGFYEKNGFVHDISDKSHFSWSA